VVLGLVVVAVALLTQHADACQKCLKSARPVSCKLSRDVASFVYISATGDDSNAGDSQHPVKTLQKAVDKAVQMQIRNANIVYQAGTYNGNQWADLSSTGELNTVCLMSEENTDSEPNVVFDGQGCDLPVLTLWNARSVGLRIGYETRRFRFTGGAFGIQITGDHQRLQISNNTFDNHQQSAIYLGDELIIAPDVDVRAIEGDFAQETEAEKAEEMAARFNADGDDDDNGILIDHNDFCSICKAQASDSCPSLPSYDTLGCSVVDGSDFKNALYVQYNLFRWAYGYGVRVAQGGAQIYKNIFSDFQRGGFILTEVSRVEVNNNWMYDGGTLNPLEKLSPASRRQTDTSCSDTVFGVGIAPQPGAQLDTITIGNNFVNGLAVFIAHFNTERASLPYENLFCPHYVFVDAGYNTVINIGGKNGANSQSVTARTSNAYLIWPNGDISATFHSNIFHYFHSAVQSNLLNVTEDYHSTFYCNHWMLASNTSEYPNSDFDTNIDPLVCTSTMTPQASMNDEDFLNVDFQKFSFFDESTEPWGAQLIDYYAPQSRVHSWPINFRLNISSHVTQSGCPVTKAGVNQCGDNNCCQQIYTRDFSGHARRYRKYQWSKGFDAFCDDVNDEEKCRFMIFWETSSMLSFIPQSESHPAPDPTVTCTQTSDSTETGNCQLLPYSLPQRVPCNRGTNFFVSPNGVNRDGFGLTAQQPLRNLEGVISQIVRLLETQSICTTAANDGKVVNIIYLQGNHYDHQYGDFSLLHELSENGFGCHTVNILADKDVTIYGSRHNNSIFELHNVEDLSIWIGAYDFQKSDASKLYSYDDCTAVNWGFVLADGSASGIQIGTTYDDEGEGEDDGVDLFDQKAIQESKLLHHAHVLAKAHPRSVGFHSRRQVTIASNVFNNLGASGVVVNAAVPLRIYGNAFAYLCQDQEVPVGIVDPSVSGYDCFAVDGGAVSVVRNNDFKDVQGSGVRCRWGAQCKVFNNLFRDILWTPYLGYSESTFAQNWVSCTTNKCEYAIFIDSKPGPVKDAWFYSNLYNGMNYSIRHVQAHQITADMDEVVPNDLNVKILFNDFLNIQVGHGLFQRQAYYSRLWVVGNMFSALSSPSTLFLNSVNEYPFNLIFYCNAWFCGSSTSSSSSCWAYPETNLGDYEQIAYFNKKLSCTVPSGSAFDNTTRQYLRSAGFTQAQFEEFIWFKDGSTDFSTGSVTNTTSYPIVYQICDPENDYVDFSTETDFYDCLGANKLSGWEVFVSDDDDDDGVIGDFLNRPRNAQGASLGFWENLILECPQDSINQFFWSTADDAYKVDLAPFPPSFFALEKLSAPLVTPSPTPTPYGFTPIPSRTPTPVPSYSPTPVPTFVPSPSPSPVPSPVTFQRTCTSCGSYVAVVAMCVVADADKNCGNYFETNLWESNFDSCSCTGGCFPVAGCNNGSIGSYYGPNAYLTTLNVVSSSASSANTKANSIANASLHQGASDVKVITAVYYSAQPYNTRRSAEEGEIAYMYTSESMERLQRNSEAPKPVSRKPEPESFFSTPTLAILSILSVSLVLTAVVFGLSSQ